MRRILGSLATVLALIAGGHAQEPAAIRAVVQVENGLLRGAPRDADGVLAFKGIPYAEAPVGELRWRSPQPARSWQQVRDATVAGNRCWSNTPETGLGGRAGGVPQSEDCLYLNVWSTARSNDDHLPVMVWIHGGGFQFGTSLDPRTNGAMLAQKGVVLVSINYRLGVFGFFAHPQLREEGRLSSNFGLQDQIAALRWIKQNIVRFGGDPEKVTIFGESAGSQSVSILMGSPLARRLFQRAIGESGSSLQQLPTVTELGMRGAAFTSAIGARSLNDLRAMTAERINAAATWDFAAGAPEVFAPSVDGYVLRMQLSEIFRKGKQADVPLLAGYNAREDFTFPGYLLPHQTAAEFRAAAERIFGAERMRQFEALYPTGTDASAKAAAEQLQGDMAQRAETWRWLMLQTHTGKAPAYGYRFAYESAYSPVASHTADVAFVFGSLATQVFAPKGAPAGPEDRKLSDRMMAYWVKFARNGDPNGQDLPPWPAFTAKGVLLQIGPDGTITAAAPGAEQLARFKFLDDYLIAASLAAN